jgi:hypothetical protein
MVTTTFPRARPSPTRVSASGTCSSGKDPVDVDADVTVEHALREEGESERSWPDGEHLDASAGDPADHRTEERDLEDGVHRAAHAQVAAASGEQAAGGEHRPVGDQVEDVVVPLAFGEHVDLLVVDDPVGAEVAEEVELVRLVDCGDVGAGALGQLDGERPGSAAGTDDQDPGALADGRVVGALDGDRPGLRDGGRVDERHALRDEGESPRRGDRVLGETALQPEVVAVDGVAGPHVEDLVAGRFDVARDVGSERASLRSSPSADARVEGRAGEGLPVGQVERDRSDLDDDLVRPGDRDR